MTHRICDRLQTIGARQDLTCWQPRIFDLNVTADADQLSQLLDSGDVWFAHDTLRQQLGGLLETRDPTETYAPLQLQQLVREHLARTDESLYGRWVFYPWSHRLVHVLGESEFRELRTSRNRNKITAEEQELLRKLRIGIIGLSVGQSATITLTLEEVGGYLHIADFDHLELSNLNRLRSGVHNLGLNKAVLCAREVFEINPYAHVNVYPTGVGEDTIDAFLQGPWGKLDLVIEECDDLQMKILVRERARAVRVPVIMQTSDRGLMDIERYDLEPDRPIFHGLVGGIRAAELKGLTSYQKVPVSVRILGLKDISDRLAASLIDIETTLKTWPQLASEVAMGGGIDVDVVRRIALGQLNRSGRFYVDLPGIISDDQAQPIESAPSFEIQVSEQALRSNLPPIRRVEGVIHAQDVQALVAYAATAFSGGNCQPWRFAYSGHRLRCIHDVKRSATFLDYAHRGSFLAFGSVAENLELVAHAMGIEVDLHFAPDPSDPTVVFDANLRPSIQANLSVDPLAAQVAARTTNRKTGKRVQLSASQRARLEHEAKLAGARLQLLVDPDDLDSITQVIGRSDMIRLMHPVMHEEMMREMRWTKQEVEQTRDGLDVATLELTPTDLAGMRLVSSWHVMKMVGKVGGGLGLLKPTKKAIASACAVGLITMKGTDARAFFQAGRATQRVWLAATELGLAFQPMTPITFMFDRLLRGNGEGFSETERSGLQAIRQGYLKLFDIPDDHGEGMLFRLAVVDPPSARSLRLRVDDILAIQ